MMRQTSHLDASWRHFGELGGRERAGHGGAGLTGPPNLQNRRLTRDFRNRRFTRDFRIPDFFS